MTHVAKKRSIPARTVAAAVLVLASACAGNVPAEPAQGTSSFPTVAAFGEKRTTTDGSREYIFDGAEWVPHDDGVEAYYEASDILRRAGDASRSLVTVAPNYCAGNHICEMNPGHVPHAAFLNDCNGCHRMEGFGALRWFDQPVSPDTGLQRPAYLLSTPAEPKPLPTISGTDGGGNRTCSNVACHGVPQGTFSYSFYEDSKEFTYGGIYVTTPAWGTTGNSCVACHGNPPRNGAWHSGQHAGGPTAATNQCQACHPDATGSGGRGTAITNLAMHVNGVVNVQARFKSSCFGCH